MMTDLRSMQTEALRRSKEFFPELHERDHVALIVHMTLGLAGEVGEAANIIKKVNRDLVTLEDVWQTLAFELADIQIYLMNLAELCAVNLAEQVEKKQKINSQRWGAG